MHSDPQAAPIDGIRNHLGLEEAGGAGDSLGGCARLLDGACMA
jgi:hypothetical protein